MSKFFRWTAVVLTVYLAVGPLMPAAAQAQEQGSTNQSAVSASDLDDALSSRVAQESADRDRVAKLLDHPRIREIAAALGLELTDARAAVDTLDGDALQQAASHAKTAEEALTGGVTLQLSLVALLLIVIIIILLAD